ncbi:Serine--pyruvate aminotransferase [Galdieria sulphuraria]|uniref:alanine--glyoxylate transaminase n=1 Tax=Galdieria sulphuraria TaxID=130081 RepID=M2X7B9_GALSU|nr:alanine--glyoxylate transaminase / serine--pyruvate aminotransferase [Galdieria sulphuraria]EME32395.1 alanine--glyoxylate transaminase / serine--pyruvate aminotransferase [Galdieria sulphuraria]GJD06110.1 Serine--pyruvate aminotransferase [Galdieria sulphuraria]|eukprot:XP_005708915.1 alanine--glyoxylate transaminase / serine--pyruvate aminotransferase [Galdieria sulphuraria]
MSLESFVYPKPPSFAPLDPPPRLLCGPGPCNPHPRVLQALGATELGHLDPSFLKIMDETKELLKYVWQTKNEFTIPVSGTGTAAMEACVFNLLEPGEKFLVGCNGYFGERLGQIGERCAATVIRMEKPWGKVFSLEEIAEQLERHRPQVLALVHAETSTGACQPMQGIGDLCRKYNCLLLLDTVTSISGIPVYIDNWKVDAAYAGTQKCLSCPPGMAPLTFGPRALEKLKSRKSQVPSYYLDMSLVASYLLGENGGSKRSYHHTAPINMCYAVREALYIAAEEGLEKRWKRHRENAEVFWNGLKQLGLEPLVDKEHRLTSLTTVKIPQGVDGKEVISILLNEYNIEVGGGLGELAGKVWRVGLMGYNSRPDVVLTLLAAFENALRKVGYIKSNRF